MKRVLFAVVSLLIAASFAAAQNKMSKVEADLIQMDKDWTAAELRGDTKAASMYVADDYWATLGDGTVQSRAQYIADLKASKDTDMADEYVVRMIGKDVAIMTHRGTVSGAQPVQYRSTHVWVNRGGKWQIVAHHSSDIAPAAAKPTAAAPAAKADRHSKPAAAADAAPASFNGSKPE
jgi:hypothetical protein